MTAEPRANRAPRTPRKPLAPELMPWLTLQIGGTWESEVFPTVHDDVHPMLDRLRDRAVRTCRYHGMRITTSLTPVPGGHQLRVTHHEPEAKPARRPAAAYPWRDIPPGSSWDSDVYPPMFEAPHPMLDKLRTTVQSTNRKVKLPLTTRVVEAQGGHLLRVTHETAPLKTNEPKPWPFFKLKQHETWECRDRTRVTGAYDAAYRYNKAARRKVFSVHGTYEDRVLVGVVITRVCKY